MKQSLLRKIQLLLLIVALIGTPVGLQARGMDDTPPPPTITNNTGDHGDAGDHGDPGDGDEAEGSPTNQECVIDPEDPDNCKRSGLNK